jgi:predicted HTH transcriptional regulator
LEDNDLEFKRELLPFDSLAKHILAMANKNGGAIVFGVEEVKANQFSPCGLSDSPDLTDIQKKISNYIPKELQIDIVPHIYKDDSALNDKIFLIIIVPYDSRHLPFISLKDGNDINRNTIYIRRNRASEPINHDELQITLNDRIDTEYSATSERNLIKHIEELKELYSYIPKTNLLSIPSIGMRNPEYPEESFDSFMNRMIKLKKDVIVKFISSP